MTKSANTRSDATPKRTYPTLAAAVRAKAATARIRGDRWRKQLRIYKDEAGWHLTHIPKSEYQKHKENHANV